MSKYLNDCLTYSHFLHEALLGHKLIKHKQNKFCFVRIWINGKTELKKKKNCFIKKDKEISLCVQDL